MKNRKLVQLIILDTPIIVIDEEIREDDYVYKPKDGIMMEEIFKVESLREYKETVRIFGNKGHIKIIAGHSKLPQIDFNGFEEKLGIVDVEKLGKEIFIKSFGLKPMDLGVHHAIMSGIRVTLRNTQQSSDKKFSLDDMRKLASAAFTIKSNNETLIEDFDKWFDNRIKTLSQPKVFDIEVEITERKVKIIKIHKL